MTAPAHTSEPNRPADSSNGRGWTATQRNWAWFVVGLLVVFAGMELAARRLGPGGTARAILEQHADGLDDGGDEVAVMFVGDSSLGANVDPARFEELTGRTSHSVWLPNASIAVVDGLITEFALTEAATETATETSAPETATERETTTEAVVIGITARMFNESTRPDRERLLAELSSSLPWQNRVDPSLFTTMEQWGADRLALIRYRAGLRRPSDWVVSYQSQSELMVSSQGQFTFFLDRHANELRHGYESGERAALRNYHVSDTEVDTLHRLIETLDERGIAVYVVLLPTYDELYDEFFPDGQSDQVEFRERATAEFSTGSAELIDLSSLGTQAELFADGNHMNRAGAEVVSAALAELIDS